MRILIDVVALLPRHLQTTDFQLISFNRCFIRTSPTLFGDAQGSHKYDRIATDRECECEGNTCLDILGKPKRPIVVSMPRKLVYYFREYTLTLNPVLVCKAQGSRRVPYGCGSGFLRSVVRGSYSFQKRGMRYTEKRGVPTTTLRLAFNAASTAFSPGLRHSG